MRMNEVASDNFGFLIAFLLPGATALWGLSPYSALLRSWFAVTPADAPTIGGFLYLTVGSLAAGMTVSAVRWLIVDTAHALSGVPLPSLDFSKLGANVEAFSLLIDIHYRFFQFHANMVIAVLIAYVSYRVRLGLHGAWGWPDIGVAALEVVFFVTSRDNLQKYYARAASLLGTESSHSR